MGNGATEYGWRHAPEACGRFGGFRVELKTRHRTRRVDFRLLAEALGRCRTRWGRWKSQNRKNVYLSPYVEEPLNSKVIKSFVLELRSRKCFSCFGIPMFYVYMLWTSMYVSHIHIMGMVHDNKTFFVVKNEGSFITRSRLLPEYVRYLLILNYLMYLVKSWMIQINHRGLNNIFSSE